MANHTPETDSNRQPPVTPLATPEDKKFQAASNVDYDCDGNVANGPYVDRGSYRHPDDAVQNERTVDDHDDSNSLFVAADVPNAPGIVQPGLVQPMAGLVVPIDADRDDITPAEERELRR
jgi:hypothetical protein